MAVTSTPKLAIATTTPPATRKRIHAKVRKIPKATAAQQLAQNLHMHMLPPMPRPIASRDAINTMVKAVCLNSLVT